MERQYKVIEDWEIGTNNDEIELKTILREIAEEEAIKGVKCDKWTIYACGDWDGGAELHIVMYRWETDEEMLEKEKQIKEQEEKEYQQYLKLKEKYEKEN